MEELVIPAEDNYPLSVTVFHPEHSNGKLLLINSATGVKQQIYFAFATFLKEQGFTVITYDYRGIGQSKPLKLKGFKATMRDWGTKDFPTLTAWIKENHPHSRKYCLGHSVGALILGMNRDSEIFEKFIFVATQNAWVGHLRWPVQLLGFAGFGILQPLTTRVLGYFPAQLFGLGESLPAGCAYDWRTLILHSRSTNKLLDQTGNHSTRMRQKALVICAEDDRWITEKGVSSLLKDTYPHLKTRRRRIRTHESDVSEIGHINYFRSFNKKLWKIISAELLKDE